MSVLYLSVDCGGSQTKVVYQFSGAQAPQYLLMSPLVEEIKPEKMSAYLDRKSSLGSPAPDREAYLKWQKRVFVVGNLAQSFDPEDRTGEQKYENALYKIAAAIGIIVDKAKLKLGKKKLDVNLGVLIPWNEYSDRDIFEKRLRAILEGFEFRGNTISCQLSHILIRPEGGGIAATHIRQNGNEWLQQRKVAVLMFGHRNTTSLYFEYGKLSGDSPLLGFVHFLDDVIERKSGLDREKLSAAIMQTLADAYTATHPQSEHHNYYPDWIKYTPIKDLAQAKDPQLRLEELTQIDQAIDAAQEEYWSKINRWLDKTLPPDIDTVFLSGGTAQFLEPDLERYFNSCSSLNGSPGRYDTRRQGKYIDIDRGKHRPELFWSTNIADLIRAKFKIEKDNDPLNIAIRLVDCYGLFDYLVAAQEAKNGRK